MKIKIELLGYILNIEPIKNNSVVNAENEVLRDYINKLTELLGIAQDKLLNEVTKHIKKQNTDDVTAPEET